MNEKNIISLEASSINLDNSYELLLNNSLLSYCQYFQDVFIIFSADLQLFEEIIKLYEQTKDWRKPIIYDHEKLISYHDLLYLDFLVYTINNLLAEINENKNSLYSQRSLYEQNYLMQEVINHINKIINKYWEYIPVKIKYYLLKISEKDNIVVNFFDLTQLIIKQSENDENIENFKKAREEQEQKEIAQFFFDLG